MTDNWSTTPASRHDAESAAIRNLTEAIEDTLRILGADQPQHNQGLPPNQDAIAGLLDQCRALTSESHDLPTDPIRTIHHFACTGGTLFSKCIAAMPNVQLLSEIDPLSTMQDTTAKPQFAPTDMIRQLKQSTRGMPSHLAHELFTANVRLIHADAVKKGLHLVLRDHAHSQFCTNQVPTARPTLRQMLLDAGFPVRSVVTIRHPVQSYIALREHKWLHFDPPSLDEYCRRYLSFLDQYDDVAIVRYEDLLEDTKTAVDILAESLALKPQPQLQSLTSAFKLTGDSGRSRPAISMTPLRPIPDPVQDEIASSGHFKKLIEKTAYRA